MLRKIFKRKNILLYCNSNAMIEHLEDYYNIVKNENYNFYIYYDKCVTRKTSIKEIKNKVLLYIMHYNLIVCADIILPKLMSQLAVPTLFVNHGLNIVTYNKKDFYTYSDYSRNRDGNTMFTKMLEPNRRIANKIIRKNNEFKNVIEFSGYKYSDKIYNSIGQYKKFRELLNINDNDVLISVFSTWGDESLFHKVGNDFFNQADLTHYKFVLSTHPKEYVKDSGAESFGNYIDRKAELGFIVRKPGDDFLPYLIASDLIFCDYSSMYELALLANKPILFSDFSIEKLCDLSIAYQLIKNNDVVIFKAGDNLNQKINEALLKEIPSKYSKEIFVKRSDYENKVMDITINLLRRS